MPSFTHAIAGKPLDILIVGGGISGIILAILLERKGYTVTLIEQCREWKPVGGGITLTLNGVKLLNDLGLVNDIGCSANRISNIHITNQHGGRLSSFSLENYSRTHADTITIMRHDLHTLLIKQLQHTSLHLGTGFSSIENGADKITVTFCNGRNANYDLVVGCDGINSSVRSKLFTNVKQNYSGYASWRFVVDNIAGIDYGALTEMWGHGKRFGIVPLTGNRVHCFASVNTVKNSGFNQNISLPAFKALFSGFGSPVPQLLDALKNRDELMYNDLEDIHVRKWYNGRVVLIGDAAHGMTPNMTQGASMAIEDAYVLANSLSCVSNIGHSLAAFYQARRKRVTAVQKKSRLFGKVGQVKLPVLCSIRNYCWKHVPDKWIQNDFKKLLTQDINAPCGKKNQ